jgi:hypothetical protein
MFSVLVVGIVELFGHNLQHLVRVHCLIGGGRYSIPSPCQPVCALYVVHHVLPNIMDDCKYKTFLLSECLLGGIVIRCPVRSLVGQPVLPMLPHELVHDDAVQLLFLAPLGQH